MLYTVMEVAELLNVSRVTVYNKLKLEEFRDKVVKKSGKTYLPDDLVELISQSLKTNNTAESQEEFNEECKEDLSETVNLNKALLDTLMQQLEEKDRQIRDLHKLIENNQVLLREKQNTLLLEERCKELDSKLIEVRQQMEGRREDQKAKSFLGRFFSK